MNSVKGPEIPIDGRRLRGQVNRSKLVAAMIDLVREGTIAPTAEQVAARAQVALRTVFRHFDDMESLYQEINTEIMRLITPLVSTPFKSTQWRGRLDESIERRALIFETILPFFNAATSLRHQSPFLRENVQLMVEMQRTLLFKLLPKQVSENSPTFAALNLVMSINAWQQLREYQGLDQAAAKQAMSTTAKALTASFTD